MKNKGAPKVYLIIRGGSCSHLLIIEGLVVIVERLNRLGLGVRGGQWEKVGEEGQQGGEMGQELGDG